MKKSFAWENLPTYIVGATAAFFIFLFIMPFTTLLSGHEKSRATSCMSNLKQIGLGLIQYAQDNDDEFPNVSHREDMTHSWRSDIYPYVKYAAVFKCPSHSENLAADGYSISYAANDSGLWGHSPGYQGDGAFAPAGAKPLKTSNYHDPAHLIALCEITENSSYDFDIDDAARFSPGEHHLWAGHDSKFNVLLADGHVRLIQPQRSAAYVDDAAEAQNQQLSLQDAYKAGDKKVAKEEPKVDNTVRNLWYRDSSKSLSINGVSILEKCAESR